MKTLDDVIKYVNKLVPIFFLQGWDFDYKNIKEEKNDVMAECLARERYRQITLAIYPVFWEKSKDEQQQVLIHEITHVLTGLQNSLITTLLKGGLVTEGEMVEVYERETTWIANIIHRLLTKK